MIRSFGGLKFTEMSVFDVAETRLLLSACAKTLHILQLHQTDPRGERPDLKCASRFSAPTGFTAASSLPDFDLSQNRSLQALKFTVGSLDRALDTASPGTGSEPFKHALSTIRSPAFSRVMLVYQEHNFRGVQTGRNSQWPHLNQLLPSAKVEEASLHNRRFKLLREMHGIRDFQLVMCANVWGPVGDYVMQALREAVAAERWSGGTFSEPLVTYSSRWDLRYGVFPS